MGIMQCWARGPGCKGLEASLQLWLLGGPPGCCIKGPPRSDVAGEGEICC